MLVTRRESCRQLLAASSVSLLCSSSAAPAQAAPAASSTIAAALENGSEERQVFDLDGSLERLQSTFRLPIGSPQNNSGFIVRGRGWNLDAIVQSSGFDATGLDGPAVLFDRPSSNQNSNNAPIVLADFAVIGGSLPPERAGTQHGFSGTVNSLDARNVLVQYMSGHGWYLRDSYSNRISNGLAFGNHGDGIRLVGTANALLIEGVRAYTNGRAWRGDQGNLVILCRNRPAYGSVLRNCDVSYSGYTAWSYGGKNIRSIEVSRNLCIVTTTAPHGLATGDTIFCRGAPGTGLTSRYGHKVQRIGEHAFGFAVSAADGNYDAARVPHVRLGPFSHGLMVTGAEGMRIEGLYAEDCGGPGGYFGDNLALTLSGGFILNCDLIVERCRGVEIGGMKFQGEAALVTVEQSERAEINVLSSNVFADGAQWVHGEAFMRDGIRYANRMPRTGDWQAGEFVVLSNAKPGQPFGYMHTASGWQAVGSIEELPFGQGR
jgi:hypothetical protein